MCGFRLDLEDEVGFSPFKLSLFKSQIDPEETVMTALCSSPATHVMDYMVFGQLQQAQDKALTEFERSLKRDPNRFRGIYGAARG